MTKKIEKPNEDFDNTEASKIWSEIKDREIEIFALPFQKVFGHCYPVNIEPSKLYLTIRSSAVLPALEASCGPNYSVNMTDRFVIISRATNPLVQK